MENAVVILLFLLPVISFLYASVGHGGASSYIMLLTLFGFAPAEIRPAALLLNIIVSLIAFLSYRKVCAFPYKLFIPLILFSIPATFIGAGISIDPSLYRKILGVLLLFPIMRLLGVFPVAFKSVIVAKWWMLALMGTLIGFVSGVIGIGGGIILSPLLLMLGWSGMKETAAISALFIFLNSIAGLIGTESAAFNFNADITVLLPLTVAGGIAGAYFGSRRFNLVTIKFLLTSVLIIASVKLITG